LVCFEKDSLGKNLPSEKTIITKNHLIYYKGSAIKAKVFINKFENVKEIKYNGEVLYNVLLKEHDKMMVNNLICETLHPDNMIGKLYKFISNLSKIEQQEMIISYNDYVIKNNISVTYWLDVNPVICCEGLINLPTVTFWGGKYGL